MNEEDKWAAQKRFEVSFKEDSDGLFHAPDGSVFGPELMEDIEAAYDAILNQENPDEN